MGLKLKELNLGTLIAVFVLGILIIGVVVGTYLTQSQQVIKSQASTGLPIELSSPPSDQAVSGKIRVDGTFKTDLDLKKLYGFFRIDGKTAYNLKFRKLEGDQVSLSGISDQAYPDGNYKLEVFLYSLSQGSPTLIGSTSQDITVAN
ncbi:hypothetical protein HYS93_01240 [Candidatus Daviesbacteria bacterium]|nr:hypothetical protein [Candidatus Daviesbacteria bacterium]